ncbi:MAG: phosphotransferase family protein [Nanobdellota archaeon]
MTYEKEFHTILSQLYDSVSISSITSCSGGMQNGVFDVACTQPHQNFIFKLSPKDYDYLLDQEYMITNYLYENTEVPVPKIYLYDASKSIIDKNCMVMEKLQGTSLDKIENDLSEDETKQLFRDLGRVMKTINSVEYGTKFGYYEKEIVPHYNTNYDFMTHEFKEALNDYINRGGNKTSAERISHIFELHKDSFRYDGRPTVSSNDTHPGNILVKKNI